MTFNELNLEYNLRQKLMHVSNAVARVSAVKSQLRISSEQARKDICNAISHQLSCVRAREQELILSLEKIVTEREQKLCEQQEQLNQAIGACQQSLECILREDATVDMVNVMKMLFKLNTIELKPKVNPEICFEFDPSNLRQEIALFGTIKTIDQQSKAATESLPLDVEHYEDGGLLSHKSVLRLSSNDSKLLTENNSKMSDSINQWLSQTKSFTPESECGFEITRIRSASLSDSSSIEVISDKENSTLATEMLSNCLSEFDCLPQTYWLKEGANKLSYTFPDLSKLNLNLENGMKLVDCCEGAAIKPMNRKRTANEIQTETLKNSQSFHQPTEKASRYVFGDVIETIQTSDNQEWLAKNRKSSLPTLYTSLSLTDISCNHEKLLSAENLYLSSEKRRCLQRYSTETNENCSKILSPLIFRQSFRANENILKSEN